MVLSPDTESEHDYRPEPESLRGDLFLADRGYLDLPCLGDLDRHGGCLMVRGKSNFNLRVLSAYREDGQRLKSCQDREVQAIISKFPKPHFTSRSDGEGLETGLWNRLRHRHEAKAAGNSYSLDLLPPRQSFTRNFYSKSGNLIPISISLILKRKPLLKL